MIGSELWLLCHMTLASGTYCTLGPPKVDRVRGRLTSCRVVRYRFHQRYFCM